MIQSVISTVVLVTLQVILSVVEVVVLLLGYLGLIVIGWRQSAITDRQNQIESRRDETLYRPWVGVEGYPKVEEFGGERRGYIQRAGIDIKNFGDIPATELRVDGAVLGEEPVGDPSMELERWATGALMPDQELQIQAPIGWKSDGTRWIALVITYASPDRDGQTYVLYRHRPDFDITLIEHRVL